MHLKIATLVIASTLFVSCSSKQKAAAPATTTPAATKDAKKADKKQTKAATAAPAKTAASAGSVVCKSGSDTRTIEVVTKDGGCEVAYTKFDQTSTPGTSASGTAHCETVKEKIKTNLENSGFKCE